MIRSANANDFNALYAIFMNSAVNPYLSFEVISKAEFQPIFDEMIAEGELLVIVIDDSVVGSCRVISHARRTQHVVTLGTLAIAPDSQGKGYGKQLIAAIITRLKQQGIQRIQLMVESDNARAIKFYKKLGFKHEGTLEKYFKRANNNHYVDEYLMALLL